MNINISCEKCNDGLEIVKEYSSRGDIEITVLSCEQCYVDIESIENVGDLFEALNNLYTHIKNNLGAFPELSSALLDTMGRVSRIDEINFNTEQNGS